MADEAMGAPPRLENAQGAPRRIGVEIEFAAVSARDGASVVRRMFGGEIREEDAHRFHIENTEFGDFVCELDTQYAHRPYGASSGDLQEEGLGDMFQSALRTLWGDVSSLVVPCEVICPPIAHTEVHRLDALVDELQNVGAEGTHANPLYAFGAQLNPEVATVDADYLTAMLKAYLFASDWLRSVMRIDMTRRLMAFADPFPIDYMSLISRPNYWPDQDKLIDDYLAANPTRNRELDMLPLFVWLDEERVRRAVADVRVKARPTFHYRLPDANIGMQDWSIMLEWRRWLVVERLAERRDLLEEMGETWARMQNNWPLSGWPTAFSQIMMLGRG